MSVHFSQTDWILDLTGSGLNTIVMDNNVAKYIPVHIQNIQFVVALKCNSIIPWYSKYLLRKSISPSSSFKLSVKVHYLYAAGPTLLRVSALCLYIYIYIYVYYFYFAMCSLGVGFVLHSYHNEQNGIPFLSFQWHCQYPDQTLTIYIHKNVAIPYTTLTNYITSRLPSFRTKLAVVFFVQQFRLWFD